MCYRVVWHTEEEKKGSYSHSDVQLFAIPWTIACPAPLSVEFSRQDYWNGSPFPSLGDLPDLGIKFLPLVSPALVGRWISLSTHTRGASWIQSVAQTADENMTSVLRLPRTEDADVRVMPKNRGCGHVPPEKEPWRAGLHGCQGRLATGHSEGLPRVSDTFLQGAQGRQELILKGLDRFSCTSTVRTLMYYANIASSHPPNPSLFLPTQVFFGAERLRARIKIQKITFYLSYS